MWWSKCWFQSSSFATVSPADHFWRNAVTVSNRYRRWVSNDKMPYCILPAKWILIALSFPFSNACWHVLRLDFERASVGVMVDSANCYTVTHLFCHFHFLISMIDCRYALTFTFLYTMWLHVLVFASFSESQLRVISGNLFNASWYFKPITSHGSLPLIPIHPFCYRNAPGEILTWHRDLSLLHAHSASFLNGVLQWLCFFWEAHHDMTVKGKRRASVPCSHCWVTFPYKVHTLFPGSFFWCNFAETCPYSGS